ncbi:uncharacterized protein ATNIH1004_009427 [Aspergillus tanneri]|uniref:Uncharacterized protein n=1 Tax=Aspergillus tanneri TaxID=1220188 RepID=A0A5M9MIN8_9EURO|nr:uncharacterized protein ATNIH1004_009427 [Aspergillus tanneri]KAA8645210.1 hypothetical protein ATNIH1004_009427 [Aspergillus tanneri]
MVDPTKLRECAITAFQRGRIAECPHIGYGGNYDEEDFFGIVRNVDEKYGNNIAQYLNECIDRDQGRFNNDRVYHFAALAVAAARGYFTGENQGCG